MTPQEIIAEIHRQLPGEWERIRDTVDSDANGGVVRPVMTEEEFARHLLAEGIVSSIPTGETDDVFNDFEPVEVEGETLSEMIIRERR